MKHIEKVAVIAAIVIALILVFSGSIFLRNAQYFTSAAVANALNPGYDDVPLYSETFFNWSSDPSHKLIPGVCESFDGLWTRIKETTVCINGEGLRDIDHAQTKPAGTYRIAALGDSFTFGWGVEQDQSWPKALEKRLNEGSKKYEVINYGVPGLSSSEEVQRFIDLDKYNEDMVIVGFFFDDAINWSAKSADFREKMAKQNAAYPPVNAYDRKIYAKILDEVTAEVVKETQELNQDDYNRILGSDFKKLHDKIGDTKTIIFIFFANTLEKKTLTDISKSYGWTLLDYSDLYDPTKFDQSKIRLNKDDQHPSPYTYQLVADRLEEEVIKNK